MEMARAYDPKAAEDRIYAMWEESGYCNPDNDARQIPHGTYNRFTVLLPPPNITGSLHMGHALNAVISDVLVRYHRMKGDTTAWLPGTDHAGIAAQNVVEKQLKKEGKTRFDLGREQFIERVWEWKRQSGDMILRQLKKIGASCDFSRTRFTMDPAYARAVGEAFRKYHKKGLIYRANRTINWCTRCRTSISDLEVEYKEEDATLYYIQYGPFVVATVRPETKFGDTALAVHPNDELYREHIGKEITIETVDVHSKELRKKEIVLQVVGDETVDPAFGTGVIKVTPAHDNADYEIAVRHKLKLKQVIDEEGRMNENTGKYIGLKVSEARERVAHDLDALGLLIKKEPYRHNRAVCSRCDSGIEPLPSWQWFVKMGGLAEQSKKAVASGATKITPSNFEKTYFSWLDHIRDWCVSRQLWWGHRLPVYFCKRRQEVVIAENEKDAELKDNYIVALEKPPECPFCHECVMEQSEDVLDTWFSSALWPFAGLSDADKAQFYPSSILITARDIINLWVGRMIFSGLEFMDKRTPFPEVLIHATVLTKEGKRMSKSLGTGIDPLALIEKYGADATRFGIIWQAMGTQDIRWDEAAVVAGKKFANKLWNAARFIMPHMDREGAEGVQPEAQTEENKAIIKKLAEAKKAVAGHIEAYEFGQALHAAYDFVWHDVCDVYLEWSKGNMTDETRAVLCSILKDILKLLHPFMPFVTEAMYQELPLKEKKMLLVERW